MANKPNTKWKETMLAKHGSAESITEFMQSIGAKGGKANGTGGFYANRELARTAGSKGGKISRRGKAL